MNYYNNPYGLDRMKEKEKLQNERMKKTNVWYQINLYKRREILRFFIFRKGESVQKND